MAMIGSSRSKSTIKFHNTKALHERDFPKKKTQFPDVTVSSTINKLKLSKNIFFHFHNYGDTTSWKKPL